MRRLVFALASGVLAALIGNWLAALLTTLQPWLRWVVSGGLGLAAALTVGTPRNPVRSAAARIASGIRGRSVSVKEVEVADDGSGDLEVASDIAATDEVNIDGLTVRRSGKAANRGNPHP